MKPARVVLFLGLVLAVPAVARPADADAEGLVARVDNSDLIVVGRVYRIVEGELDQELLKMDIRFRIDVASIAVAEVLRGDPELRKVTVGFPGFPKPDELKIENGQDGVWLLTKSDRRYYEARARDRFLPMDQLGAVRRALRTAAGGDEDTDGPVDRAAQVAALLDTLAGDGPAGGRRLAAFRLGGLGRLEAVPGLIEALNDEAASVRVAADLALRKLTGRSVHVDFENAPPDVRLAGAGAWAEWWSEHHDRDRKQLLLEAVQAGRRPQPDFRRAVEGLAQFDDVDLQPFFRGLLAEAMSTRSNALIAPAARYFGRTENRSVVPELAKVLEAAWTDLSARAAVAVAIGRIVGQDFGTGPDAVEDCLDWWRANRDSFR